MLGMERGFVFKKVKIAYLLIYTCHAVLLSLSPLIMLTLAVAAICYYANQQTGLSKVLLVGMFVACYGIVVAVGYDTCRHGATYYEKRLHDLDDWLVARKHRKRDAKVLKSLDRIRNEARLKLKRIAELKDSCRVLADEVIRLWPASYRANSCPDLPNANYRALRQRIALWNLTPQTSQVLAEYCEARESLDETEARLEKLASARNEVLRRLPSDQTAVHDDTDRELENVHRNLQGWS